MRQDRFLVAILAGIALLVVASLIVFFSRRVSLDYVADDSPAGVVQNYLIALQKSDYQRAYEYLSGGAQRPEYLRFFQDMSIRQSEINRSSLEVGEASISGNQALVQISVLRVQNGIFGDSYRTTEPARLSLESGKWKINAFPYPFWSYDWFQPTPDKIIPPPVR